jgi:hypothetical protein
MSGEAVRGSSLFLLGRRLAEEKQRDGQSFDFEIGACQQVGVPISHQLVRLVKFFPSPVPVVGGWLALAFSGLSSLGYSAECSACTPSTSPYRP